jgi:hypothetical protein
MTKRKAKVVAVAGSRSFPLTPEVGAAVVDMLRAYPQGTLFLTRGSEGFDTFVVRACEMLELPVEVRGSQGGRDNYLRDVEMVRDATEVLVFLDPGSLHDERTGTSHILDKSLDQKKPVTAYSVAGNALVYVGSTE